MRIVKKTTFILLCMLCLCTTRVYAGDTLNVMVFATPGAIRKMGGADSATVKTWRDIDNINQSFVNSKIDGYTRLVFRGDYDLPGSYMYNQLNDVIAGRNSKLDAISNLWPAFGADVVVFIVDDSIECGIAGDYGNPNEAFVIVSYKCMGANYSMARELGYLLGCGNNETQAGRYNYFSDYAYAYFHDYELSGDNVFATIMGYTDDRLSANDEDFNMIPYWSTADTVNVRYHNMPVGDDTHDNARQAREGLKRVASYRSVYTLLDVQGLHLLPYQMAKLEITEDGYLEKDVFEADSHAWLSGRHMSLHDVKIKKGAYVSIGANIIR